MKNRIKNTLFVLCSLVIGSLFLASCNGEEMYDKEMYKPVLYLLSGSENVYTVVYPFKEDNAVGYFSVGCGGSLSNPEEITVQLEKDTVLFDLYNRTNFVFDSAAYARLLPEDSYVIENYTIKFPANSPEQYVKVPIKVNQQGLSPDSIYFIPLAIKSVSKYEVNPEKKNVLFRVAVENDYAEQITQTNYYLRGTIRKNDVATPMPYSGSKIAQPLSKDEIRLFAGNLTQSNKSTLEDINKNSIIVKINEDKSVIVRSYDTIEVEQLEAPNYNRYYTLKDTMVKMSSI